MRKVSQMIAWTATVIRKNIQLRNKDKCKKMILKTTSFCDFKRLGQGHQRIKKWRRKRKKGFTPFNISNDISLVFEIIAHLSRRKKSFYLFDMPGSRKITSFTFSKSKL
jgi:hypothetical protein